MKKKKHTLFDLSQDVGIGPLSRALGVGERHIRKILSGERNLSAGFIRRCISVYGESFDLMGSWVFCDEKRSEFLRLRESK